MNDGITDQDPVDGRVSRNTKGDNVVIKLDKVEFNLADGAGSGVVGGIKEIALVIGRHPGCDYTAIKDPVNVNIIDMPTGVERIRGSIDTTEAAVAA